MGKQEFSIASLANKITTEADAYKLLETLRWTDGQPDVCPQCGVVGSRCYFLKPMDGSTGRKTRTGANSQRRVWKCGECRKQFSVLTGTIFHGTKIPIRTWLFVIFEVCAAKNSVSARAGTARITPVRLPSLSEGPAAFIHTGNLDGILDDIFNVAAKRPGLWLSPSDVTEQALHYGWKPNDGREPAAVIRPKLRAMTDLVARQRDGRTKEYRLRAAAGLDEVSLDAVGSDFGPASSEAGPTEASENGSSSHADVLVGAFGAQQPAG